MGDNSLTKGTLIIRMLILAVIFGAIGVGLTQEPLGYIKGVAFGALFSIVKLHLMELTLKRAVSMHPKKAHSYAVASYMVRYIITGIVLLVSALEPSIHILGTVAGLFTMKAAAFLSLVKPKNKKFIIKNE